MTITLTGSYAASKKDWRSALKLNIPARRITVSLLMLPVLLWSSLSIAQDDARLTGQSTAIPREAMAYFFDQSFNNLKEELEIAIDEKKSGVFIMFSDKDCPWCLKMKTTILNQVDVQDYYHQHFRLLTVDIRGDALMTDFQGNEVDEKDFAFKQHRVRATPVFMFFDTEGNTVMRLTGIVRNVEEFMWLGEFVVSGAYKKTNFTKYKRQRASQSVSGSDKPN
ncbi:MAG: thioredoxin family protein [Gammaproteobacteria bacterium]|nr:thioredoxin family protein [Gammaproteobacteria bacterium]